MASSLAEVSRLTSVADAEAMLAASQQQPVFLLKHSATCPVSAVAHAAYSALGDDAPPRYVVTVQSDRAVSDFLARALDVRHESPQALLIDAGTAVWAASHGRVRTPALAAAARDHATL